MERASEVPSQTLRLTPGRDIRLEELVPFSALSSVVLTSGEVAMFSGYIFDVEGTLVDSVPQNLRSLQEALEQAGIDIPYRRCNCTLD